MVANPTYIIRRGATLVFRRRVPAVAKNFYAKSFFCFSLRTHFISEARRRAATATRFTDDLIGLIEMCGADMLDERQLDCMIDDLMRFEVATSEALRETCGPRGPEAVSAAVRLHEATRETMRAALIYNDYDAVTAPLGRTLDRLGLPVEAGSEDWLRAARRAARVLIEVADENIHREQGIYRTDTRLAATLGIAPSHPHSAAQIMAATSACPLPPASRPSTLPVPPPSSGSPPDVDPGHDISQGKIARRPESGSPEAHPETAPARLPVTPRAPEQTKPSSRAVHEEHVMPSPGPDASLTAESRFSAWFEDAMARKREENPGWDTNNLGNWRSTRKLFIEAHGDRPMSFFGKTQLLEFRSLL